jgi:hypothetical protein
MSRIHDNMEGVLFFKWSGNTVFRKHFTHFFLSLFRSFLGSTAQLRPWPPPYVNEIIGDYQCGIRRNRFTTDQIFYIRQIVEKKM